MKTLPDASSHALADTVKQSWRRFLELYEPHRPDLFRYCRHLTRSPWDAEDLAQDAMARAFATLGCLAAPPPNPKAWLFRVASNLWIDQTRRSRRETPMEPERFEQEHVTLPEDRRASREAAGSLIGRLSPQERVAVVLKDAFDLSLDEIAETLSTTPGAVKAALHRGRGKLVEPPADEPRIPAPAALDAFCAAFNARDLDRVASLLLKTATIDVVGITTQYGTALARTTVLWGMLFGSERMATADTGGGMEPRYVQGVLPTPARFEARLHRGEWLVLSWYAHVDGEAVRAVTRVEIDEGGVSRLHNYFFTPDFIAEVCRELGVPFRVNGYRSC